MIARKITAFQAAATEFQPCRTQFQTDTTIFQPITTIGSGALRANRGRGGPQIVNERTRAKQVASGEKGKPLSLKLAHFAKKSRGGGTIGWDFKRLSGVGCSRWFAYPAQRVRKLPAALAFGWEAT